MDRIFIRICSGILGFGIFLLTVLPVDLNIPPSYGILPFIISFLCLMGVSYGVVHPYEKYRLAFNVASVIFILVSSLVISLFIMVESKAFSDNNHFYFGNSINLFSAAFMGVLFVFIFSLLAIFLIPKTNEKRKIG